MCGLTGYLSVGSQSVDEAQTTVSAMGQQLTHRGPDGHGVWVDVDNGVALAHRRLAVVDLSTAGQQPMHSACDRYVLVFNGEIYNHQALRKELEDTTQYQHWRGYSDTETLLAGFSTWGVLATLRRCVGMFAFALWDKSTRTLTLGRDRMGEKPLYYGWQGRGLNSTFMFGSDLASLKVCPAFSAEIDRNALCLLLRHNYIPAPYSIYVGISKLEAGCLLTVSRMQPSPNIERYWSVDDAIKAGSAQPFAGTAEQAIDRLEGLLADAVHQQMMADVPIGAFLSGGVDSSAIAAIMQARSAQRVRTFTIGFNEVAYNEAPHAKAIAAHLGTEHTELYVTAREALDVIPRLPELYSEPFSDPSQIPTYLVAQLAREQVKVCLTGDAGDELFSGYQRYSHAEKLWNTISRLPLSSRRLIATGLKMMPTAHWNVLLGSTHGIFTGGKVKHKNWGEKLHRGAELLSANALEVLYRGLVSHWQDPSAVVIGGREPQTFITNQPPIIQGQEVVPRLMALDMRTYLPDDILVKLDRSAMGVSLEGRVPLLDHRVVEFAWTLPQYLKQRDGVSKWILRQVLYRYVPKALIERPKMGFGVPIGEWLRGPLKDWAESLLDETRLAREGYFRPESVRQKWTEHINFIHNWEHHLWSILMFQAWLEKNP